MWSSVKPLWSYALIALAGLAAGAILIYSYGESRYRQGKTAGEIAMHRAVQKANAEAVKANSETEARERAAAAHIRKMEDFYEAKFVDLDRRLGEYRVQLNAERARAAAAKMRSAAADAGVRDGDRCVGRSIAPDDGHLGELYTALGEFGRDAERFRLAVEACQHFDGVVERLRR